MVPNLFLMAYDLWVLCCHCAPRHEQNGCYSSSNNPNRVSNPIRPNTRTCFSKDAENLTTYGYVLCCSQIWYSSLFFEQYNRILLCECKGVRKGGGLGLTPPLELDILQKLYCMHKGDWLFLHTFCLLICRLNAKYHRMNLYANFKEHCK